MQQLERIYQIHQLLKVNRRVSMQRLMEELESSRATVNRDLAHMRNSLFAPIEYDKDRNGYYYDASQGDYELPGMWFNASELYALLATEQLLEGVQPGLLADQLGPLRERITGLLQQSGLDPARVGQRILLRTAARRRVDNDRFGVVAGALLGDQPLQIRYQGRGRDTTSERCVHPYRLIHYRDNWYLVAWCEQAQALRTFALDRIRTATPHPGPLHACDDATLAQHLDSGFGIFGGDAGAWAELRFDPLAARWVADEEWHPGQRGEWHGDYYHLHLPYADPRELLMDVLRHGARVEVLAPPALRQAVVAELQRAATLYTEGDHAPR